MQDLEKMHLTRTYTHGTTLRQNSGSHFLQNKKKMLRDPGQRQWCNWEQQPGGFQRLNKRLHKQELNLGNFCFLREASALEGCHWSSSLEASALIPFFTSFHFQHRRSGHVQVPRLGDHRTRRILWGICSSGEGTFPQGSKQDTQVLLQCLGSNFNHKTKSVHLNAIHRYKRGSKSCAWRVHISS